MFSYGIKSNNKTKNVYFCFVFKYYVWINNNIDNGVVKWLLSEKILVQCDIYCLIFSNKNARRGSDKI